MSALTEPHGSTTAGTLPRSRTDGGRRPPRSSWSDTGCCGRPRGCRHTSTIAPPWMLSRSTSASLRFPQAAETLAKASANDTGLRGAAQGVLAVDLVRQSLGAAHQGHPPASRCGRHRPRPGRRADVADAGLPDHLHAHDQAVGQADVDDFGPGSPPPLQAHRAGLADRRSSSRIRGRRRSVQPPGPDRRHGPGGRTAQRMPRHPGSAGPTAGADRLGRVRPSALQRGEGGSEFG
jgi:hypothetical protein